MKRMTAKARLLAALLPLVATITSAALDCPPAWDEFDDSCYKVMTSFVYSQSLSWENARAVCLGYGGDLVSIENEREMEFIRFRYSEYMSYSMWIGLNDRIKQREFVWSDGTPFNGSVYSNWRDGEPNDWFGNEDCVELYNNGWNDLACSRYHYYMCERPKGKLPCPDGWFPNGFSCYKASESEKPWINAKQDCYESGGYLMKIDDESEQHFLEVYLRSTGIVQLFNQVWIGLSDIAHEGRFTWEVDNSTVNFSNWEPGQPNNGGNGRQHCVTAGAKEYFGLWNDDYCPYPYLYICEKPLDGISCYQCESSTSFAECSTKRETVNCAFPRNYCFKQKNTTGDKNDQETVFYKGCTLADQCRKKGNNSLECCEDDLCNTDISCYQCSSNISFANCAKNQKRVNCTLPKNRCVKTIYGTKGDNKTVTYYKGCATTDECTEFAEGPFAECCTGDMCNKESGLSCFECSSTVSHEACQEHQQEVTCQSSMDDRCYYAWMQQTSQDGSSVSKRFRHGCTNNYYCNSSSKLFDECSSTSWECEVRCCSHNLCNEENKEPVATVQNGTSTVIIAYISFGVAFILIVMCFVVVVWCYRKTNRKQMERSSRPQREVILLDKWEILPEQIEYEEELGRGAFGVVYKAILKKRQGLEVFGSRDELTSQDTQVVAVKELQDDPSEVQKEEFLFEIAMMKVLGAHHNILSMVGCCTLQDHKFLVIEYVPFGDLLQWLRSKRKSISPNCATGTMEKQYDDKEDNERPQGKLCRQRREDNLVKVLADDLTARGNTSVEKESPSTHENEGFVLEMPDVSFENWAKETAVALKRTKDGPRYHIITKQTSVKMDSAQDSAPTYNPDGFILDLSTSSSNKNFEYNRKSYLDQENIKLSAIPSTSQANQQTADGFSAQNPIAENEEDGSFTTQQLFSFAWQIARGMNHLAEKDFVHRDLAARNILVGRDNRVKVSDFGLMRQIYEDVYTAKKTKKLPVKWMAPESIRDGVFTIKSDVWSYGVLLWEMATMGGVPYPTMSSAELCRALKTGYRMERPDMCCDEVYELMTECWRENPATRPSFSELIGRMEAIMTRDVSYCDLSKRDESSPYYNVPAEAVEDSGEES